MGTLCLGGGIVLINLNERRSAKQNALDDAVEPLVASLTDPDSAVKPIANEAELDGTIFHAFGDLRATPPWPGDPDLHLEAPQALRIQRDVQMYQWKEHREERKKQDSKDTEVVYTYTRTWSSASESTRDNRNPSFPKFSKVTEAKAVHLHIPNRAAPAAKGPDANTLRLKLGSNFVERIHDFESTKVQSTDSFKECAARRLEPHDGGNFLYTAGHDINSPEVGDLQIRFQAVPPGEYTTMGMYDKDTGIVPARRPRS